MSSGLFTRLFLAASIAAASAAGASGAERVVNVYNWSDYIDPGVLADFTAETGIAVNYDVFDSNDIVETKLLAGDSGYDVVISSYIYVYREIAAGALLALDKARLPNLRHAWPEIDQALRAYDPENRYALNYMWGTTGLGYNIDKVAELLPDAPLDSWALLFDPRNAARLAECGIIVLDAPDDVIPAALTYLGLDPQTDDPAAIRQAGTVVETIRPFIQKFDSSNTINALANGDVCLTLGYSGDVIQARDRAAESKSGIRIAYSVPKEGAAMSFDNFVIPEDAPHPDEAHIFLDYMLRPEVAARNSNHIAYANGNRDSQPLLDEDVIGDPAIYPDAETMARLFTLPPRDMHLQRTINRLWADLKSGEFR